MGTLGNIEEAEMSWGRPLTRRRTERTELVPGSELLKRCDPKIVPGSKLLKRCSLKLVPGSQPPISLK